MILLRPPSPPLSACDSDSDCDSVYSDGLCIVCMCMCIEALKRSHSSYARVQRSNSKMYISHWSPQIQYLSACAILCRSSHEEFMAERLKILNSYHSNWNAAGSINDYRLPTPKTPTRLDYEVRDPQHIANAVNKTPFIKPKQLTVSIEARRGSKNSTPRD